MTFGDREQNVAMPEGSRVLFVSGRFEEGTLGGKCGQSSGLPLRIPDLKPNIPSICPPALLKRGREHTNAGLRLWVILNVRQEKAQAPHTVRLLCTRDQGPAESGPTKQQQDPASLHELPRVKESPITARGRSKSPNVRHELRRGAPSARCRCWAALYQSMIWSVRSSRDGGIVRPSALAVLRLMTSSNFVGSSTGRSAGFAPLRIRST